MKTKSANIPWKLCVLLMALMLGSKIQAAVIDLVLTEFDGDTLTAGGLDGANWTIVGSGDSWTGTRSSPLVGMAGGFGSASWSEPEDPRFVNVLEMTLFGVSRIGGGPAPAPTFGFNLTSDVLANPGSTITVGDPDGTVELFTFKDANGNSTITYTVQFIDLAGAAERVPDVSSTALCFIFGLASLLWFKRHHALDQ